MASSDEKKDIESISPTRSIAAGEVSPVKGSDDDFEVFKLGTDGVQFRLVGWVRASVIFLKSESTSIHRTESVSCGSDGPAGLAWGLKMLQWSMNISLQASHERP
jgi:hypothetical protein